MSCYWRLYLSAGVFYGDGSALTGIDASTLKSGSDVKAQANPGGVVVTGVLLLLLQCSMVM